MDKVQTPAPPIRLLLTPDETAAALGLHRSRVWMLMGQKKLFGIKIGRSRRFELTEIQRFIEAEKAAQYGDDAPPAA